MKAFTLLHKNLFCYHGYINITSYDSKTIPKRALNSAEHGIIIKFLCVKRVKGLKIFAV